MKKYFCWLMILFIGVACQEEKVQNIEEPQEEMKEVKMAALNICGDTEDADILLLCADGSYILCDADNQEGYSVLYMNDSINNDFENGLTVFLDENGIPVMASSSDGQFVFKNVTGDSFDFAFIDKQNEISYYNDIKFDFQSIQSRSMFTTRSIFDPWIDSWKTLTSGGWDEHNKKAIVPFLCKIASFAITAGDAVWGTGQFSLAQTFISELYKSSYDRNKLLDDCYFATGIFSLGLSGIDYGKYYKNGELVFTPKSFELSLLAALLNNYGDSELEKLGQIEEWVGPHFDTEEWRISLSTNLLECYPDDDWYLVDVRSKAKWDIDESQIDHNWCEVKKLDVQVALHVKPNEGENDRTCNLVIYAKNSTEIAPVSLTIKQSGIVFELSEEKLSFTQDGGSKGVYITSNDNIKSWDVTSYPTWCKIEKGYFSFFVDVDKSEDKKRNGIITVTAMTKRGLSVDRYISVEQIVIPLCPDNNHPHAIDLGLPSGTKWACCNVGASAVEQYGNYYAWGETKPKDVYSWNTYKYYDRNNNVCVNIGSDIAGTGYDAARVNWGAPWCLPSLMQVQELIDNTTSTWVSQNGVYGRKFTGANGSTIFLPAAGYRMNSALDDAGASGCYLSSTLDDLQYASYDLYFSSYIAGWKGYGHCRCYGLTMRPVRYN